jgi:hypothetical protein
MTGKEHTSQAGARKVSRSQSQPTSPAARPKTSAAQTTTREQQVPDERTPAHAAEVSASSPDGAGRFRLELPVVIDHLIGLDPAALPPHRVKAKTAVRGMAICESLFWVVQQFGLMASSDHGFYADSDLYDALDCLGEVGRAVAAGASDQAQYLEQITERLHGGEGGHDHDQT